MITQEIIRKNIEIDDILAEVHEEGIGLVDYVETIEYETNGLGI